MDPLLAYTLHLADNALIIGHRNSEWTGHGPVLEQDIAISNIALDLIGQSRNFYQYAAQQINQPDSLAVFPVTEDTLAYQRDAGDFKNCLLVEQSNGDWAKTIVRQFFFSAYQFYFFQRLQKGKDETLAAIAEKSLKEVAYHLRWAGEWVIRLGDGTEESHDRTIKALRDLWMYTGELFEPAGFEQSASMTGIAVDVVDLKNDWKTKVATIFEEASLSVPENCWMQSGGKSGRHSEQMGFILAEMQFLQRAYPGNEW